MRKVKTQNLRKPTNNELCYLYAKWDNNTTFKAFDINNGRAVGNLIYATILENTQENQIKLQNIANDNKHINLILQLRPNGQKVVFQTK